MKSYCTYFDRAYLLKALTMLDSLQRHETDDYRVFAVCLDEISRILLEKLCPPNVVPVPMHAIERGDAALLAAKRNRSLVEYYWTATPTVILRLMESHPEIDILTYLDADLFFYSSPQSIFDEFGGGSVLIHEHRLSPALAHLAENGKYNVGLLCFRSDPNGFETLRWWRDRCIEWCYGRPENGKFADQGYLNDWPTRFRGVRVLRNIGAGVAPWNHQQYRFALDPDGRVLVDGQPLVFYHFHSLLFDSPDVVIPAKYPAYALPEDALLLCYIPYLKRLDRNLLRVRSLLPDFSFGLLDKGVLARDHTFFARSSLRPGSIAPSSHLCIPMDGEWNCYASPQMIPSEPREQAESQPKPVASGADRPVTAIVSTFNSERFMRGCLEDLEAQTIADKVEIIVIDSGSEQNERAIVEEFQRKYDNIRYFRTERESLYASWNRAIKLAGGKYITNANTDDRHRRDALAIQVETLENNPDTDLVYGDIYTSMIPNESFEENRKQQPLESPDFFAPDVLFKFHFGPQPMWRKTVHARVGYFDEQYRAAGDYDFNIRFAFHKKAMHIPEFLGTYLHHEAALSYKDSTSEEEKRRILEKYRSHENVERLYAQEGAFCNSVEERSRLHLDFGSRILLCHVPWLHLRQSLPWLYGDFAPHIAFARESFMLASRLCPRWIAPYNNLAITLYLLDMPDEACRLLEMTHQTVPEPTLRFNFDLIRSDKPEASKYSQLKLMLSGMSLPEHRAERRSEEVCVETMMNAV